LVKSPIVITNMARMFAPGISETAISMLFALTRGLNKFYIPQFARHQYHADRNLVEVDGLTMGIVGMGGIGQAVATRAHYGFNMRILYSDAVRAPSNVEEYLRAEYVDSDKLFRESDFVTLHVPLLPETRHLISKDNLAKMKRTAFLINTSRGPVVDEAALAEALDNKKIAGAALDVFENEPKVNPALVGRHDVILTPHIASASVETRTKMAVMAANNVAALFQGKRPPNALNADALELK